MFGSSPGVFENRSAAIVAALAFEVEEQTEYGVVQKHVEIFNKQNSSILRFYYRPCRSEDLITAAKEGWLLISLSHKTAKAAFDDSWNEVLMRR